MRITNRPALVGVAFALLAAMATAVMGFIVKFMTEYQSVWGILFFQNAVATLFVLPKLIRENKLNPHQMVRQQTFSLHLLRACTGLGACGLSYYSIKYVSLSVEMVFSSTYPLFVPFFALIFRHLFNFRHLKYIALSFLGVWLVADPRGESFHPAAFLALASGACGAMTIVLMRELVRAGESPARCVFNYAMLSTITTFAFWLSQTQVVFTGWPLGLALGVVFCAQQYAFNLACRYLDPVQISVLMYTSLVFTGICDAVFWHLIPTSIQIIGMLLVSVASIGSGFVRNQK